MKGYSELIGLGQLRTMHTTKQRSIPRMERLVEIELYLLQRERERFVKEAYRVQQRYENVLERIRSIDEEIARQEKIKVEKQRVRKEPRPISQEKSDWKTKKMNY